MGNRAEGGVDAATEGEGPAQGRWGERRVGQGLAPGGARSVNPEGTGPWRVWTGRAGQRCGFRGWGWDEGREVGGEGDL